MAGLRERKAVDYTGKDSVARTPGWLKSHKVRPRQRGRWSRRER